MNSGKTNILDSLSSISNSAFRNQCLPNSEGEFPTTFGSSLSVQRKSVSSIGLINTPEFAVNQNHSVGDLDSNNEIENTTAPQQDTCHSENENILCVVWANGSLGGAFYSTSNAVLQCLEDCMESTSFYFTEKLLSSMNPHVILTCSRQDSIFINFIAKHTGGDSENSNIIGTSHSETHEFHRGVVLEELPLSDFNYVAGRNKILNLKIPGMPENATQIDKAIYISGLIPLDKELMIKCAGALLMYLEKIQVNVQREQQSHSVSVIELKLISLTDYLTINDDTLKALYVFRKEVHPSVYKSFGYGKEGLSLFGIFNKTKSSIGSTLFRSWMNNPLKNFNEIQERLVCIEFLSKIKNTEVLKLLQLSIRKAKNLQPKFAKMLKSVATLQDWQSIVKTCSICLDIKNICDKLPANISIFHKFQTKFIPNAFQQILKLIERFIDFNASSLHGRFIIKKDIDSILDKKKSIYESLPELLQLVANEELKTLPDYISECTIIYLPQVGYLMQIKENDQMNIEKGHILENAQFIFFANTHYHYKTACCRQLDESIGDTLTDIANYENALMQKLQQSVLVHVPSVNIVMQLVAELDCLCALAVCAKEFSLVKPVFTEENIIDIKKSRNILQELSVPQIVANDIQSGYPEFGKIKVITGANACGKSVYINQVGLVLFLAHIGSFVPATSARLCILDGIFSRLNIAESISTQLSTFSLSLGQISSIVKCATKNSVVLIDEFGKGTGVIDGVSLFLSILRFWENMDANSPHIFASTHFYSFLIDSGLDASSNVKYMTFSKLEEEGEVVFLYELIEGRANYSYASCIANQMGIPRSITDRSNNVAEIVRRNALINSLESCLPDYVQKLQSFLDKASSFCEFNLNDETAVISFGKK